MGTISRLKEERIAKKLSIEEITSEDLTANQVLMIESEIGENSKIDTLISYAKAIGAKVIVLSSED